MQPPSKRHLPLVKPPENNDASAQSPLLWAACSCVVTISIWVPMAIVSLKLASGITHAGLTQSNSAGPALASPTSVAVTAGLVLASFGLACAFGGLVLGRFSERASRTHAMLSCAGAIAVLLFFSALGNALRSFTLAAAVAVSLTTLGTAGTLIGYRIGRRRQRP